MLCYTKMLGPSHTSVSLFLLPFCSGIFLSFLFSACLLSYLLSPHIPSSLPSLLYTQSLSGLIHITEDTMSSKSLQASGGKLLVQESPVW